METKKKKTKNKRIKMKSNQSVDLISLLEDGQTSQGMPGWVWRMVVRNEMRKRRNKSSDKKHEQLIFNI